MLLYALRRLIYLVPVAFGVSLLVFALVHLAPGDPISAIVPPDAPQEVVDKLKEYYGFDKPLPIQYLRWLGVTLTGDFGTSIGTGRPVATEVMSAFGNTIILATSGWRSCWSSSSRSSSAPCRPWESGRRTRPAGASTVPTSPTWSCRPSRCR